MNLCGSHIHFYACRHQSTRQVTPLYRSSSAPRKPYVCLAPDEVHSACPQCDRCGDKHRAAGIIVNTGESNAASK